MREGFSVHKIERRNERSEKNEISLDQARSQLESRGVLSTQQNPETGQIMKVVDDRALGICLKEMFPAIYGILPHHTEKLSEQAAAKLVALVGNEPVILKRGPEGARAKPFFYVPQNAEAATNSIDIKNAEFHHAIWDYLKAPMSRAAHPTEGGGTPVSMIETRAGLAIFHPDYGDGFRAEDGTLYVRNAETRKYEKFSSQFLSGQHGISKDYFTYPKGGRANVRTPGQGAPRSVREGIAAELPNLVRKNLIKPIEDLRQVSRGSEAVEGRRVERSGVLPSGGVLFHGVLHYIGRGFVGKPVRVVEISPTMGAVIDTSGGGERVTHTFNIVPREKALAGKSNMFLANAPLTQVKSFSAKDIALPRTSDESEEKYFDRIAKTDEGLAHLLLKVLPKHPELSKLLRDRPGYEQASIAQAAYLLQRDGQNERFDSFVEKYGESGARTFLVTANDEKLRDAVFSLGDNVRKESAKRVFQAYESLISGIDSIGDYLREQFSKENPAAVEKIVERMLDRARDLLRKAHEYKNEPEKLIALVGGVDAGTKLFTDACKTLQGSLNIEDIQGGSLESITGREISDAEKKIIQAVQEELYAGKYPEEEMQELRIGLEAALDSDSSRFYIYRKEGEIVTFLRFDGVSAANDAYMGSFMTNPKYEGGGLGQALLSVALEREITKGKAVNAVCDPSLVSFYERFGFRLVRGPYADDHGVETCDIVLEPWSEPLRMAA